MSASNRMNFPSLFYIQTISNEDNEIYAENNDFHYKGETIVTVNSGTSQPINTETWSRYK